MENRSSGEPTRTRHQVVRGRYENGHSDRVQVREPSHRGESEAADGGAEPGRGLSHITLSTPTGELRMLLDRLDESEDHTTAFQSVVVALTQALNGAMTGEHEAAEAAISLAQREKLQEMIEELREVASVLHESLDENGLRLLDCSGTLSDRLSAFRPAENSESAWWFSLSEASEAVRGSADRVESMMQGQGRDCPARQIACIVARLLRRHHRHLLFEAERWMAS